MRAADRPPPTTRGCGAAHPCQGRRPSRRHRRLAQRQRQGWCRRRLLGSRRPSARPRWWGRVGSDRRPWQRLSARRRSRRMRREHARPRSGAHAAMRARPRPWPPLRWCLAEPGSAGWPPPAVGSKRRWRRARAPLPPHTARAEWRRPVRASSSWVGGWRAGKRSSPRQRTARRRMTPPRRRSGWPGSRLRCACSVGQQSGRRRAHGPRRATRSCRRARPRWSHSCTTSLRAVRRGTHRTTARTCRRAAILQPSCRLAPRVAARAHPHPRGTCTSARRSECRQPPAGCESRASSH